MDETIRSTTRSHCDDRLSPPTKIRTDPHPTLAAGSSTVVASPQPAVEFAFDANGYLSLLGRCQSATACGTTTAPQGDHALLPTYDVNPRAGRTAPQLTTITVPRSGPTTGEATSFVASWPTGSPVPAGTVRMEVTTVDATNARVSDTTQIDATPGEQQTTVSLVTGGGVVERRTIDDVDPQGRVIRETRLHDPDPTSTVGDRVTSTRWLDDPGRDVPMGGFLRANLVSRVVDATGAVTTSTYDPDGMLASVTNDNGATTSYTYAPYELYTTGSGVPFTHPCATGTCPTVELAATVTHPNSATDTTLYQGGLLRPAATAVPLPGMATESDQQYDGTPAAPLVRRTTFAYWDGASTTLADDRFLLHQTIIDPAGLADTTTIDRYDQNGLPYRVNTNAATSYAIHDGQGLTLFTVDATHSWNGGSLAGWQADEGGAVDTLLDDPNLQTGTWTQLDGFGRAILVTTPKWTAWRRGKLYQTTTSYDDAAATATTSDPAIATVSSSTTTPVDPYTTAYTPVAATYATMSQADALGRVVTEKHATSGTPDAERDTHYASTGEVDWVVTAQERTRWLGQVGGTTGTTSIPESMFGTRTTYDFLGEPYRTDHDGYDPSQAASSTTHQQLRTTFSCYDGDGRVTITYPPTSGLSPATTGTSLDCNPDDVTQHLAPGYNHAVVSAYDGVENTVSSYTYTRGAETWDYDLSGNVIDHTDTRGVVEHSAYNLANERYLDAKPIDASSYPTIVSYATTYTTYDAEGNVRASFDPMASSKTGKAAAASWMTYSAATSLLETSPYATENTWTCGRLDRAKRPSAIGAPGTGSEGTRPRQRYVYDPDGRLVKTSPWYVATSDTIDDAGAFKTQSCASSAVGTGWAGADVTLLTLEDSGAIAADQTPGRNTVVYRYDFPADPAKKTYRAVCSTTAAPSLAGASTACAALGTGEQPETWSYDTRGWVHPVAHHSWASPATTDEVFVSDLAGRVTSASVNAMTAGFEYERHTDFGELYDTATRTQFSDAAQAWVKTSYSYDPDGNVLVRSDRQYSATAGGTYTTGTTVTSTYNPDGTVATVLPSAWGAKQLAYYYDASGRLTKRKMWNASTNTVVDEVDYAYTDNGLVTTQDTYKGNNVAVEQHAFSYVEGSVYSDGSVTQDTYWRAGVANSGRTGTAQLKCTTLVGNCRDIYHYDFLNRLVSQATSWGWETGGATYVPTDETVCYTLLPDGRTSTIYRYKGIGCTGSAAGSTGNTYDAAGALTKQTITTPRPVDVASPGILVERRFLLHDAAGDVACTRRTMDDATTTAPANCAAAKPVTLQEWWKESDYTYGEFDRVASQTSYNAPAGVGGSNIDTYTRDALGRVVRDAVVYHQQGDTYAVETAYVGASSTPVTEANDYGVGNTLNLTREITVGGAGETLSYGYTPNHRTIASGTYLPLAGARGETSVVLDSNDTVMQTYGASPDGAANIVTSDASLNVSQITAASTAAHQTDHATISTTRHATADTGAMPPATVLGGRVYRSDIGGFVQFDTYHDPQSDLSLTLSPSNSARSTYAGANPEAFLDPDGHRIEEYIQECHNANQRVCGKRVCGLSCSVGVHLGSPQAANMPIGNTIEGGAFFSNLYKHGLCGGDGRCELKEAAVLVGVPVGVALGPEIVGGIGLRGLASGVVNAVGECFQDCDPNHVMIAFGVGAVAGPIGGKAIAGAGSRVGGRAFIYGAAAGGFVSAATSATTDELTHGEVDWWHTVAAAAPGSIFGSFGAAAGPALDSAEKSLIPSALLFGGESSAGLSVDVAFAGQGR